MQIGINGILLDCGVSGVETAIYQLARTLAARNQVAASFYMREKATLADIAGPSFNTRRCRLPGSSRLARIAWEQTRLPAIMRQHGVDLIHAPGYVAPWRTGGIPVVITIYDLIALHSPQFCKPSNVISYRLQLPLSVRKANGIIVCSQTTCDDLLSFFPQAADKVRVIPLGVNPRFQPVPEGPNTSDLRQQYGLPDKFMLFVGQLEPKKNIPGILDAYQELHRRFPTSLPKLVVAGQSGWGCEPIDRRMADPRLAANVVFPGFIPEEDLPALYSMAEFLLFPSWYEGFGFPPLEAMACGTPAIVSNRGSLPEVVGQAALVIDPEKPPELVEAMLKLLQDKTLHQELRERGKVQAGNFNWQRTAALTEQFYRDILT